MKVLISAYAFEPGKGSEPGVGWHWANEIARRGHEVVVLTCGKYHKQSIEQYISKPNKQPFKKIIYYDLPWQIDWVFQNYRFMHYHCYLWQFGAFRLAKFVNDRERFDVVHHITWGSIRFPSHMGKLGIPFVLGPVGGGEYAPWKLRVGYVFRGWFWDCLRDLSNIFVRFDPFVRRMFRQATSIYAKTEQSKTAIPKPYQSKVSINSGIGVGFPINPKSPREIPTDDNKVKLLYVGRFIYWKGFHLGLHAFSKLLVQYPNASLTMVGQGREEVAWRNLAKKLCIDKNIEWIPWVDQIELISLYNNHDILIFPSLHDSSGLVVLEALSQGLPVVCFDLGGPAMLVNSSCGRVVRTGNHSRDKIVSELTTALQNLTADQDLRRKLSVGAIRRAQDFTWEKAVDRVYRQIESIRTS